MNISNDVMKKAVNRQNKEAKFRFCLNNSTCPKCGEYLETLVNMEGFESFDEYNCTKCDFEFEDCVED